jgi:hypothetical protein
VSFWWCTSIFTTAGLTVSAAPDHRAGIGIEQKLV